MMSSKSFTISKPVKHLFRRVVDFYDHNGDKCKFIKTSIGEFTASKNEKEIFRIDGGNNFFLEGERKGVFKGFLVDLDFSNKPSIELIVDRKRYLLFRNDQYKVDYRYILLYEEIEIAKYEYDSGILGVGDKLNVTVINEINPWIIFLFSVIIWKLLHEYEPYG